MTLSDLPLVNASLNATSGVLLVFGYISIRQRTVQLHKAAMIAACAVSALFLTSYVIYHANIGSKPFPGRGPIRAVYFAILLTHVDSCRRGTATGVDHAHAGVARRFDRHVAIARWTFPIWLYVSVTGVIVYVMLYRMYRI